VNIRFQQRPEFAGSGSEWSMWYSGPQGGQSGQPVVCVWRRRPEGHFRVRYQDGVEFWVDSGGRHIWLMWPDDRTPEDAALYLLGPILGLVLRLKGVMPIHASAVCVDDQAIALVGPGGAGKSTLAAGFARSGFTVLSDDVSALTSDGIRFVVQPGCPYAKLWPASVEGLYGAPDVLPKLVPSDPTWDKRCLDLTDSFERRPRPLGAVYMIGKRRAGQIRPTIESLTPSRAFVALVANTYVNYLLTARMRAEEFEVLTWITRNVPVRTIAPSGHIRELDFTVAAIVDDCRSLHASARGSIPTQVPVSAA
jgi:hypothetical protein